MEVNALPFSWAEALEIMDDNFPFRSRSSDSNSHRSYRVGPNEPSMDIWLEAGKINVHRKFGEDQTDASFTDKLNSDTRQIILDEEMLINYIKEFKGSSRIPKPKNELTQKHEESLPNMRPALNTILYGPPGTGKTFKTAELAVECCDGYIPHDGRLALMARYNQLCAENRISFVTFHQSYGYEDFVEGIRPISENGQVTYPVRPGIFKNACDDARPYATGTSTSNGMALRERIFYKMSLGAAGTQEGNLIFQDCIENGYVLLGWGDATDCSDCETMEDIIIKTEETYGENNNESAAGFLDIFKHQIQIGDFIVASQGNKAFRAIGEVVGEYEFLKEPGASRYRQMRRVIWHKVFDQNRAVSEIYNKSFTQISLYRLNPKGLNYEALERLAQTGTTVSKKNFVLIIDEINRANISKVFGELITLLEPDKRDGELNALSVKLPYSGKDFSIPSNLHIIGTMNTADRSIALLDTALRRRFEFQELQPDHMELAENQLNGVDLRNMLCALNERIEFLYDRDHTIGHAYFIGVTTIEDLDIVFRRKVIPLLQEYFFEDWSKVRLALNDRQGLFIESKNGIPKGMESEVDGYEQKYRYNVLTAAFPINAYLNIYQ